MLLRAALAASATRFTSHLAAARKIADARTAWGNPFRSASMPRTAFSNAAPPISPCCLRAGWGSGVVTVPLLSLDAPEPMLARGRRCRLEVDARTAALGARAHVRFVLPSLIDNKVHVTGSWFHPRKSESALYNTAQLLPSYTTTGRIFLCYLFCVIMCFFRSGSLEYVPGLLCARRLASLRAADASISTRVFFCFINTRGTWWCLHARHGTVVQQRHRRRAHHKQESRLHPRSTHTQAHAHTQQCTHHATGTARARMCLPAYRTMRFTSGMWP
jgi:hypothetical protein